MTCYRLFGTTLETNRVFRNELLPGRPPADLTFTMRSVAKAGESIGSEPPRYISSLLTPQGDSILRVYSIDTGHVLRFAATADFHVTPRTISCLPSPDSDDDLIEIDFLGTVASFWLEAQGIVAMHASAVVVGERAVAFASDAGNGKSGLAASFVAAGNALLSDDVLPIEQDGTRIVARFGYPQMRLWPDQAAHFLGSYEGLERIEGRVTKRRVRIGAEGFGRFHDRPTPLVRIYLPDRRPPGSLPHPIIQKVGARDAVIELVRHSFAARLVHAMGWQVRRLDVLTRVAQTVPIRRLIYASGFDRLPAVRDAIMADLET